MDEKIKALEEKIAYLEHHVTEQDKAMLDFVEQLAALRRELTVLRGRVAATSENGEGGDAAEERPPHY